MASTDSAVAILPIDLGTAAAFDQNDFPLAYYEEGNDNLSKGSLLIKATLQEMEEIKQLGIDLNKNDDFIYNTRLKLEALRAEKAKLQDNRKTFNPIKAFLKYRAARLFHAASIALYLQTKSTSEKIRREEKRMRVVPGTQIRAANDVVSPDTKVVGFVIELPDGMNDSARQTMDDVTAMITDPFANDSSISQIRDGEQAISLDTASILNQDVPGSGVEETNQTSVAPDDLQPSRPTSPQTINIIIQDSIVHGLTTNYGSRNSGASVTTREVVP